MGVAATSHADAEGSRVSRPDRKVGSPGGTFGSFVIPSRFDGLRPALPPNKERRVGRVKSYNSRWEGNFPVVRELPGGKRASCWEESFLVGRELPAGKIAFW